MTKCLEMSGIPSIAGCAKGAYWCPWWWFGVLGNFVVRIAGMCFFRSVNRILRSVAFDSKPTARPPYRNGAG